ncbi:MAG: hypothetical protein HC798_04305 [Polaribacter sp.]|nr:hypothetical protein [Polaribacter sp.]
MPGVKVIVKGTTIGTETDFDGNYEIKMPEGEQMLVFSYLGFKPEERVVYNKRIDVEMEEDESRLEEVVVVGYGEQKIKKQMLPL